MEARWKARIIATEACVVYYWFIGLRGDGYLTLVFIHFSGSCQDQTLSNVESTYLHSKILEIWDSFNLLPATPWTVTSCLSRQAIAPKLLFITPKVP